MLCYCAGGLRNGSTAVVDPEFVKAEQDVEPMAPPAAADAASAPGTPLLLTHLPTPLVMKLCSSFVEKWLTSLARLPCVQCCLMVHPVLRKPVL